MSAPDTTVRRAGLVPELPPDGRAAIRGGVWGNYVDQINIFLPVTALAPALPALAGPHTTAATAAIVVMATLIGRPLGAMVFGQIADRIGRTATTKIAIAGTAACTLGIALVPDWRLLGAATIGLIIALRFVGGAFLAGEYASAIPLAMEWSTPRRRGLVSGRIMSMAPWAQGTIAFVTVGLLALLGLETYAAWGWRLSFVAGACASLVMLFYYARRVADAPVFTRSQVEQRAASSAPRPGLRDVLFGRWARSFWQVFGMMTGLWFCTNMVVIVVTQRLPGLGLSRPGGRRRRAGRDRDRGRGDGPRDHRRRRPGGRGARRTRRWMAVAHHPRLTGRSQAPPGAPTPGRIGAARHPFWGAQGAPATLPGVAQAAPLTLPGAHRAPPMRDQFGEGAPRIAVLVHISTSNRHTPPRDAHGTAVRGSRCAFPPPSGGDAASRSAPALLWECWVVVRTPPGALGWPRWGRPRAATCCASWHHASGSSSTGIGSSSRSRVAELLGEYPDPARS